MQSRDYLQGQDKRKGRSEGIDPTRTGTGREPSLESSSRGDQLALREAHRVFSLIAILAVVTLATVGIAVLILYRTAIAEERERLTETAQSQARLIGAVARFDSTFSRDFPEGPDAATISQVVDAHRQYKGFGETGEFTLARREGDLIVFLLSHRHSDLEQPRPVAFRSDLAEPMRKALLGLSGTVIGLDYRGETVLAAHEPVPELDLGIVAKIDLAEIRAPFIRAGLMSGGFALLAVVLGALLFVRITNPMLQHLQERTAETERLNTLMKLEIAEREEAEKSAQDERDRARKYLDIAGSIIVVIGTDRKVQLINKSGREILGYEDREIVGRDWFESFLPKSCQAQVVTAFEDLIRGRADAAETFKTPVVTRAGEERIISWHNRVLTNDAGQIIAALSSGEDITAREAAQEALQASEERWRSLVEWAPDFITIVDRDFTIQFINHAPPGIQIQEVVGASAFDYISPDYHDLARKTLEHVLETGQGGQYVVPAPDPLRNTRWYENHVGPLKLGDEVVAVTIISTDITERKLAEEALEWGSDVNSALAELANTLVGPARSIEEITRTVLDQTRRVTRSRHGYVSSIDPGTKDNVIHTFSDMMQACSVTEKEKKTVFPIGEDGRYPALWGYVMNNREPFYTNSPNTHSSSTGTPEGHIPLLGFLSLPVMVGNELLGQIALANPQTPYTERDLDAVRRIGSYYALAMQRHRAKLELLQYQENLEELVDERTLHLESEIAERKRAEDSLQDLGGRLISAQEEERGRIARELHDNLNQRLALLGVQLEQLARKPPPTSSQLGKIAGDLWQQTRDLSSEVHHLSHRLRPAQLEHVGLVVALRRLSKEVSKQQDIRIDFRHKGIPRVLNEEVSLCLYRIVQEALNNVARHSSSESAKIELTGDPKTLNLKVSDSGNGFDLESARAKGGLGLANMRERVRLLGGKISILTGKMQGTEVSVSIPRSPTSKEEDSPNEAVKELRT